MCGDEFMFKGRAKCDECLLQEELQRSKDEVAALPEGTPY